MSDMPMAGPGADKNVTKTDIAKNNSNSKGKPLNAVDIKGKMKKTLEETDWKEVVGPYPVVSPGTREASFVHAISSAGVAHAVTRSCSSGELENCGCDRSLRGMSPEGFQVSVIMTPEQWGYRVTDCTFTVILWTAFIHVFIYFSVVWLLRQC